MILATQLSAAQTHSAKTEFAYVMSASLGMRTQDVVQSVH